MANLKASGDYGPLRRMLSPQYAVEEFSDERTRIV